MSKTARAPAQPAAAEQLPAVPTSDRMISGWLSVQEIVTRKQLVTDVMRQVMKEGEHYGASFPGDTKQNLLKPGADVLLMTFQLVPTFEISKTQLDGGHRDYEITCTIKTMGGAIIAVGVGSCSTMEKKYRWRHAKPRCPQCGVESLMRSRYGAGGWYCNPKWHGCGKNTPGDQVEDAGKVENEDIADVWNTCLKIGKKRAMVDATITALAASDIFAQDAEDLRQHEDDAHERDAGGHQAPPPPTDQRQDQQRRDQPKPNPAQQQQAPPPPPPPPQVNQDAAVDAELAALYDKLVTAAGKPTASKFWARWAGKDKKAERLTAFRQAVASLTAIEKRLGGKAERMIADITVDRSDPDNVDGILADLVLAAGIKTGAAAAAAPGTDDQPPY